MKLIGTLLIFILCSLIFEGCKMEPIASVIIARGSYPDIAVDREGNVHVVYGRNDSLFYRKLEVKKRKWSEEISPANILIERIGKLGIERSDPDIVIDNENKPHVFVGSEYACQNGKSWIRVRPFEKLIRDTELAIDSKGNAFLAHRGGNNSGELGIVMLPKGKTNWLLLTDPDASTGSRNDHVYPDLVVSPVDNMLWVVQRHGLIQRITCHFSADEGKTWHSEPISDDHIESPHVAVDYNNNIFVTTGSGHFLRRVSPGIWADEGRIIECKLREQPELAVDHSNHVYCMAWGGKYNIRVNGQWTGQKNISSLSGHPIGFVEAAGYKNYAFVVWEEGETVNSDTGTGNVDIAFGIIKP